MEDVELRDFAADSTAPGHNGKEERRLSRVEKIKKSAFWRFWETHIRITIDEVACRDHLGMALESF